MSEIAVGLILETVVAILLCVTVGYCYLLDKRLRALRSGKDELKGVINELNQATERAAHGITHLKSNSDSVFANFEERMTAARALADELTLITESADNIANRIERASDQKPPSKPLTQVAQALRDRAHSDAKEQKAKQIETMKDDGVESKILQALRQAR